MMSTSIMASRLLGRSPALRREVSSSRNAHVCFRLNVRRVAAGRGHRRPFYSSTATDPTAGDPSKDAANRPSPFAPLDTFPRRHIGPSPSSVEDMLKVLDPPAKSLDDFVKQVLPTNILSSKDLSISGPSTRSENHGGTNREGFAESQLISRLREIANGNKIYRSYIGCGYAGTRVPEVIKRNVLENPGWYTSYTPYQPEISQGRLQSLLNFQTMVSDLTALSISNASVLDEPTAAAEAMTMSMNALSTTRQKRPGRTFLVSHLVHPQTTAVHNRGRKASVSRSKWPTSWTTEDNGSRISAKI